MYHFQNLCPQHVWIFQVPIVIYALCFVLNYQSRVKSVRTPQSVQGSGLKRTCVPTKNDWFRLCGFIENDSYYFFFGSRYLFQYTAAAAVIISFHSYFLTTDECKL